MKIDSILSGLRQAQDTTKVASDTTASPAGASAASAANKTASEAPREALVAAVHDALAAAPGTGGTKVASAQANPITDVMKVAEELAATEKEASVKHAQVMGAAFADAFVARLGAWQTKAAALNQQAPAGTPAPGSTYQKVAAENPGLLAQAQGLGYAQTKAALEKQAHDAYVSGFNDTVNVIHKTASAEFIKGAAAMNRVLDAALRS